MYCLQTTKINFLSSGHVKLYIHVLKTSIKMGTVPNMLCFGRDGVLASKTSKVKI